MTAAALVILYALVVSAILAAILIGLAVIVYRDAREKHEYATHRYKDAENVRRAAYKLMAQAERAKRDADRRAAAADRLWQHTADAAERVMSA